MKKLLLALLTAGVAHAEMPKPEPQLYLNTHEYLVLINGKEVPIEVYRRIGKSGQIYEVHTFKRCGLIGGGGDGRIFYYYSDRNIILDFNQTKVIREIHANQLCSKRDGYADPEEPINVRKEQLNKAMEGQP